MKRGKASVLLLFSLIAITAAYGCDAITGAPVYEPSEPVPSPETLIPAPTIETSEPEDDSLVIFSGVGIFAESMIPPQPGDFERDIINADLIVVGTITDLEYEVISRGEGEITGQFAYTIFTLTVEKVIKGDPNTKEVSFKTEGGFIEDPEKGIIEQHPRWNLEISDRLLIGFQREEGGYWGKVNVLWGEGSQMPSEVWITYQDSRYEISNLKEMMGYVIKILKDNNIPVPPQDEPIPIPIWPTPHP